MGRCQHSGAKAAFENATCVAKVARTGYTFKLREYSQTALDYEAAGCDDSGLYNEPISKVYDPGAALLDGAGSLGIGLIVTGAIARSAIATLL
jgi:hypothetical protein